MIGKTPPAPQPRNADFDDAVLAAAISGDAEGLERALARGGSPDAYDSYGESALQWAARMERVAAFDLLLRWGANVNDIGPVGNTALHCLAAYPRMLDGLKAALARGAEVSARNDPGETPIFFAVRRGNLAALRVLIQHGASPDVVDNDGGNLVLHLIKGDFGLRRPEQRTEFIGLLREFLALGIDPAAIGSFGASALTLAAEGGHRDALAAFAEFGFSSDAADRRGFTPLQVAARRGHRDAAQDLLRRGAELDIHSAASLGDLAAVQALLRGDPRLVNAVHQASWERAAPLACAIQNQNAEVALHLLEHGADPNGPDPQTSSLHNALRNLPDLRLIETLIARGANLESGDGDNNTPLNFAARFDRIDAAKLLLAAGADADAETERGYTPDGFAVSDEMRTLLQSHRRRGG